jgi:hypothetical protein
MPLPEIEPRLLCRQSLSVLDGEPDPELTFLSRGLGVVGHMNTKQQILQHIKSTNFHFMMCLVHPGCMQ